jgi:hypothetical protein
VTGVGHKASNIDNVSIFGTYSKLSDANNTGTKTRLLKVGVGINDATRKDGMWVTSGGLIGVSATSTGSGTPSIGSNCPAITTTAPFTWIQFELEDGSIVYVPAWK